MRPHLLWQVAMMLLAGVAWAAGEQMRAKDLPERWRTWLEEEIYPVISREERDAFLKLSTDEQRQEFVTHLWTTRTGRRSP